MTIPFLFMEPEGTASQEPAGEVFEARDLIAERFVADAYDIPIIVEARDGDLLAKQPLAELLENSERLRDDPDVGPKLYAAFDPAAGVDTVGMFSLADAVDAGLRAHGVPGIAAATDAQVKQVGSEIIDAAGGPVVLRLSDNSARIDGRWVVPALTMLVRGDDAAVGGPPATGPVLGVDDTTKEEFNREVEELVRGDEQTIRAWGVGFDVNLTSTEQGAMAGPFIGFVILAVLLIVGLVYRSYWTVALGGAALAIMIIWLRGVSNLIGLEQDQILALIVPIAMISFGIDFAFHGLGRYREERNSGNRPRRALTVGLASVLGALLLALVTSAAAFLANVSSQIQSIVQFGIAATIGLVAACYLLGAVLPTVQMWIDDRVPPASGSVGMRVVAIAGIVLAAGTAMAVVLLSVFLAPVIGVGLLAGYLLLFIAVPAVVAARRGGQADEQAAGQMPSAEPALAEPGRAARVVGAVVTGVARLRAVVLGLVAVGTVGCAYLAVQVQPQFDVSDFFNPSSRFVVSLDKLDEHGGEGGGEPADIYLEGDLTDPGAVASMATFVGDVRKLDGTGFGRDDNGDLRVETGVLGVLDDVLASPAAREAVSANTGVGIAGVGPGGYPRTTVELAAIYDSARESGVAFDEQRLAWTPGDVRSVLWQAAGGDRQATVLRVFLSDTRGQEAIAAAEDTLQPLLDDLEAGLREADGDARVQLSGSPITRQASLEAVSQALQFSLPIALVLCLLIAALAMRSLRYAVVCIVPIALVVAWLYAFMYTFGFDLNLVTATIGAISIGIGVDFAIHFAMRYRAELGQAPSRAAALRVSGETTGLALGASAVSSMVGFGILAFAPMPLFATYGLLTAVMIAFALAASLLVLPSLLALVTREPIPEPDPEPEPKPEPVAVSATSPGEHDGSPT